MTNVYGYARVSTFDQNLDRQLDAFRREGIKEENTLIDKVSGKNFKRASYLRLIGLDGNEPILREGDCLVVLSLDRLGRDYEGLREEWRRITHTLKADIKVLDMPLLDTTSSSGTLDKTFVSDLTFQILSYVAAKERQNMLERQRGGIEAARARGVYSRKNRKGGKKRLQVDAELFEELFSQYQRGAVILSDAAAQLGLCISGLSRRFKERREIGAEYNPNTLPLVPDRED